VAYLYLAVLLLAAGLLGFALGWAIDYWVFVVWIIATAGAGALALGSAVGRLARRRDRRRRR